MKKKILIMIVALMSVSIMAFSLVSNNEPPAPNEPWSFDITWDDSECNCGTPIAASLTWELWQKTAEGWVLIDGASEINPTTEPYTAISYESLVDCQKCYKIYAAMVYTYNGVTCCEGEVWKGFGGKTLFSGDVVVNIVMQ